MNTRNYFQWSWLEGPISPYVENKSLLAYSPTGIRTANFNNYFVANWVGNTVGPPQVNEITLGRDITDCVNIKRIRYWNYVFDENTTDQMMTTDLNLSIRMIGGQDR